MRESPRRAVSAVRETVAGLRGGGRGWVLFAVASGWLLVLGTRVVVPQLLPQVTAEFDVDNATAGAVMSLLWAAYAATQLPSGLLVDRIGERATLVASLAITVLGGLLFASARSFSTFAAACVLFGFGTGLYATPRVTVLSNVFADRDSTALGVTFAAGNVGAAILPVVAATLAALAGWRYGFVVVVPVLLVVAVLLWRSVPPGTSAGSTTLATEPRKVVGRLASVALHPTMLLAWTAMTLVLFTYQGITAFLPTYLQTVKGIEPWTAAVVYGLFYASGAVTQSLAGVAGDRFDETRVLAAFSAIGVLTLAALPFVDDLLGIALVVVVLGTRLSLGSVGNGYVAAILPDDVQGSGYGLFRTVYLSVGAVGSIFVGVLAERGLFDEAFLALAAITGLAALLFLALPGPADVGAAGSPLSAPGAPPSDVGRERDETTD